MAVGPDVKALTLKAATTSPYARIDVSGNNLKEGENQVKLLVTAENGTKRTYTIKVTKAKATPTPSPTETPTPTDTPSPTPGIKTEARIIETDENGNTIEKKIELQLADTLSVEPPEDYQKDTANVLGIIAEVYKQTEGNVVLVELSDGQLYIYDQNDKTFTLFRTMHLIKRNYRIGIAPADKVPEGYKLYSEEFEGMTYYGEWSNVLSAKTK